MGNIDLVEGQAVVIIPSESDTAMMYVAVAWKTFLRKDQTKGRIVQRVQTGSSFLDSPFGESKVSTMTYLTTIRIATSISEGARLSETSYNMVVQEQVTSWR